MRPSQTGVQKAMSAAEETLTPAQLRMARWSFVVGVVMLVAEQFNLPLIVANLAGIDVKPHGLFTKVVVVTPFLVAVGAVLPSGLSGAGAWFAHVWESIRGKGKT